MSDDLLNRLDNSAGPIFAEAAHRIRELESACYRLTEERDRLKGWADKYHDEVLELRARVATEGAGAGDDLDPEAFRALVDEILTKEDSQKPNDYLATKIMAAHVLDRAETALRKANGTRAQIEAIRSLKPKADE